VIGSFALRLALAAAIWWAFAEGEIPDGAGAVVAAAAVVATAAAGLALRGRRDGLRPRPHRMPRFAAFFLWRSLLGGLDVARRALTPRVAVDPGFVDHDPQLPEGSARALHLALVSVMPGTLVAEEIAPGGALRVHVIDTALPVDEELERVGAEVRLLFGLPAGGAPPASPQARP
jgi:multicomponent Na+:H+ antiporter subunit E